MTRNRKKVLSNIRSGLQGILFLCSSIIWSFFQTLLQLGFLSGAGLGGLVCCCGLVCVIVCVYMCRAGKKILKVICPHRNLLKHLLSGLTLDTDQHKKLWRCTWFGRQGPFPLVSFLLCSTLSAQQLFCYFCDQTVHEVV